MSGSPPPGPHRVLGSPRCPGSATRCGSSSGLGGDAVELNRRYSEQYDDQEALRSLDRVATGKVPQGGHGLRVKAPHAQRPLLIVVGQGLSAGDLAKEMIPGVKLWKRIRGE